MVVLVELGKVFVCFLFVCLFALLFSEIIRRFLFLFLLIGLYIHNHYGNNYLPGGPSLVEYGTCPRDRAFPNEVEDVRKLSYAKLHAFDYQTHGQFFWNFRTEFEPRWDFLKV